MTEIAAFSVKVYEKSPLFNDENADITFKSSDDILFKIFKKHLESTSAGFSVPFDTKTDDPNDASTNDESEFVCLDESSDVLELLFQFIHPPSEERDFRQPSVMNMNMDLFFKLAEAAEKYIVFSAMGLCITRMEQLYASYPAKVLNHCAKHDYPTLGDKAAYESLIVPFDAIVRELTHPGLVSQWVLYYGRYATLMKDNINKLNPYMACPNYAARKGVYAAQFVKDPRQVYTMPGHPLGSISCSNYQCTCKHEPSNPFQFIISSMPQQRPMFSQITI